MIRNPPRDQAEDARGVDLKNKDVECAEHRHSGPVEAEVGKEELVPFTLLFICCFL